MPTIPVPAPPKSAFNKNRPVSDLLQHQLKHFQHIEAALPNEFHSGMTTRDLHTENGAAKYIAHLTEALKSLHRVSAPAAAPIPIRRKPYPDRPLNIAAVAAPQTRGSDISGQSPTPGRRVPAKAPSQKLSFPPERSRGKGPAIAHVQPPPPSKAAAKSKSRGKQP